MRLASRAVWLLLLSGALLAFPAGAAAAPPANATSFHVLVLTEGNTADSQFAALKKAFDEHCAKVGPSVDPETFRQLQPYQGCGSQVPMVNRPS